MTPETASYIGLIVAIFGIPFAILVARYFAVRPRVTFAFSHEKVLDSKESKVPSSLRVQFNDAEITNLHRWKIGIWNSGNHTFDDYSFIESDPIQFAFTGHRVLDVQGRISSRDTVQPAFTVADGSAVEPSFEILDRTDGFVFFVLTECQSEEVEDKKQDSNLKCSGSLKALPSGLSRSFHPSKFSKSDIAGLTVLILALFSFGAFMGSEMIGDVASYIDGSSFTIREGSSWDIAIAWLGTIFFLLVASVMFLLSLALGWVFAIELFRVPKVIRDGFHDEEAKLKSPVRYVSRIMEKK